ncbi:MAG: HNH endonuclease signature motif containing protein [Blastocatellia bacterium]|nr:HNH endonuclease signature motif containing protein [Blastocatellia bacterium]
MTKHVPPELRRQVVDRAGNCCEYCRYPGQYSPQAMSIDHIEPREAGGETVLENLALSCQGCNGHKAARTTAIDSVSERLVPLFNPRLLLWREHFAWSEDYLRINGLTAVGRATIEALQLNRDGLVNIRRVLYAVGEHPPRDLE